LELKSQLDDHLENEQQQNNNSSSSQLESINDNDNNQNQSSSSNNNHQNHKISKLESKMRVLIKREEDLLGFVRDNDDMKRDNEIMR